MFRWLARGPELTQANSLQRQCTVCCHEQQRPTRLGNMDECRYCDAAQARHYQNQARVNIAFVPKLHVTNAICSRLVAKVEFHRQKCLL